MANTTNYNLAKPAGTDNVSIDTINGNMDLIDTQMKTNADAAAVAVQTTDIVDNLTSAATNKPLSANQGKELKAITDTLNENLATTNQNVTTTNQNLATTNQNLATTNNNLASCFQSVSSGKSSIASAITDKGVTTASDATFKVMATNIGRIQTGGWQSITLNYADVCPTSRQTFNIALNNSSATNVDMYYIVVSNLGFIPEVAYYSCTYDPDGQGTADRIESYFSKSLSVIKAVQFDSWYYKYYITYCYSNSVTTNSLILPFAYYSERPSNDKISSVTVYYLK